eukprot:TRINITY_DN24340_c0_g1_i1.p2 TRINITY_DN24340_c0_g1~~TRINITY_DN24340_c0_g1_i1.p2  ORF type:complete len:295 (+),score=63.69 TRINITY_DN24340_c0_g1_i1:195-1079(+)
MSLLEHDRGSPHFVQLKNWERAIAKETFQKAHADAEDNAERLETLRTINLNGGRPPPRRRGGTPPATPPKPFKRNHHKNRLELTNGNDRHWPGAFDAHVTACPGSGFLPKPNMFVPGVEPALGPVPKKLMKGDYPASYVFAKGNHMGTMGWPGAVSEDAIKERKARQKLSMSTTAPAGFHSSKSSPSQTRKKCPGCHQMTLSASSPSLGGEDKEKKAMASNFGSNFGRCRPPSGIKAVKAEARLQSHINSHRPDEAYGSTSWFLATSGHHHNGWIEEFKSQNRADSGQVYYWGC